jgi:hypothetical protein
MFLDYLRNEVELGDESQLIRDLSRKILKANRFKNFSDYFFKVDIVTKHLAELVKDKFSEDFSKRDFENAILMPTSEIELPLFHALNKKNSMKLNIKNAIIEYINNFDNNMIMSHNTLIRPKNDSPVNKKIEFYLNKNKDL